MSKQYLFQTSAFHTAALALLVQNRWSTAKEKSRGLEFYDPLPIFSSQHKQRSPVESELGCTANIIIFRECVTTASSSETQTGNADGKCRREKWRTVLQWALRSCALSCPIKIGIRNRDCKREVCFSIQTDFSCLSFLSIHMQMKVSVSRHHESRWGSWSCLLGSPHSVARPLRPRVAFWCGRLLHPRYLRVLQDPSSPTGRIWTGDGSPTTLSDGQLYILPQALSRGDKRHRFHST